MKLYIFTKPQSKIDQITWKNDSLHVKIKAPAKEGAANAYLITFLAHFFEVPTSAVHLQKGAHSRYKTVEIIASPAAIQAKIDALKVLES